MAAYEIVDSQNYTEIDLLYKEIIRMIDNKYYREAEKYVLDNIKKSDLNYLKLLIGFYSKLNLLSDSELEQNNISRNDLYDNYQNVVNLFTLLK